MGGLPVLQGAVPAAPLLATEGPSGEPGLAPHVARGTARAGRHLNQDCVNAYP